ncbi:hypothetical protein BT93_B2983 [Corymbia citriodora subsp. variegata]|nr:hypothetical protein BT93_B2983 [Corymbia citriodora subsp. variegata]
MKNMLVKPLSRLANHFPVAHGGGSRVKPSLPTPRDGPGGYHSTAWRSMSGLSPIAPVQVGSTVKANHVRGPSIGYYSDDENVDSKAASYINNVRERFRSYEGVGPHQAHHPKVL